MQLVELYSKENCGYCVAAKQLLEQNNIAFTQQILGIDYTREMILERYSDATTFPVVVVDGMYIGGFHQLRQMVESLKAAPKFLQD